MRRLGRRLRARYDYAFFQVSHEWPLLVSVGGVILGAATILPSAVGIVLGVIAFVVGLGAFLRDVHELRRRWADYEFTAIAAPFPASSIPPQGVYPVASARLIPALGTALVSDPIDQAIPATDIPAQLDDEAYRLPQ